MKKALFYLGIVAVVAGWLQCSGKSEDSAPTNPNNPAAAVSGQGLQQLAVICSTTQSTLDSASRFTKNGNEITIRLDSAGTAGFALDFTTVNDSQAIARIDTTLIPPSLGATAMVFKRMTGSGSALQNELWQFDSLRITTAAQSSAAAMPPGMYMVLDSSNGQVKSTFDTTRLKQSLTVAAISGCPLLMYRAAKPYPQASIILQIDSLDTARSTCDTTWGFSSGQPVYVVSNGTDSLHVYNAATKRQKSALDLNGLVSMLLLFMPAALSGTP